jgi:hypothetical protein
MAANKLNKAQKTVLRIYENGEFAHLAQCKSADEFSDELENCGDGLLRFLMVELASSEDCDSIDTAADRVRSAMRQLTKVVDALEKATA